MNYCSASQIWRPPKTPYPRVLSSIAEGLHHPKAERQFSADLEALEWADTCVLILPYARSAYTEAGWMAGAGKRVVVYIPEMEEPELMYKLFTFITNKTDVLVDFLRDVY